MAKKKKNKLKKRSETIGWFCSPEAYETLCVSGYSKLSDNPEVQMAINYIADLISGMTIYLMRNTSNGDIRIKNELSRKIDIEPYKNTTKKTWMYQIVRNMMLYGNQVVIPKTENGYLIDLQPISPAETSFIQDGEEYRILYREKKYLPDEVLHFLINPDPEAIWKGMGYKTPLKDIVHNLRQAEATKKGFMESKWKPSLIIKTDGLIDEFSSKEGRKKLLREYIETSEAGEPWVIPAEQFEVEVVKPLSLEDLAINDAVTIDKKTVAGILGVPPYVVGAGEYNTEEHRHFIDNYIRSKAQIIEQELTKKLLYSPDLYFYMNSRALYSYNMKELSEVGESLYVRGIVTGNEVRNWISMPPKDGLDDLVILENYIPRGMIGEQSKLMGGEKDG